MPELRDGLTERLAEHALAMTYEQLPPAVLERTKQLFLDFLGVALGAAGSADSSGAFEAGVRELARGQPGRCTVVGSQKLYPPHFAALLNGAYAHSMDFDDTHREAILHPGAPVFPTLLALGEVSGASGKEFLAAAVAGYDVACKIGKAHGAGVHNRGFHPTATTGIFGATAGGARLLGLNREALLNALGLNGSQAAGSLRFLETGSWNKRLHVGLASHNAIYALTFARHGILGAAQPLEGRYGYFTAYSQESCDLSKAVSGLGSEFEVMNTAVKPYPSCRYNHGVIDAVLALLQEHELVPQEIARMDVALNQIGMDIVGYPEPVKRNPQNIVDGQFSVYFAAAAAAVEREFTWKTYARLQDPETRDLIQRVSASVDKTVPGLGARVTVATRSGGRFAKDVPLAKGEPETFLTWQELHTKFRGLASEVLADPQVDRVADRVMSLERLENLNELTRQLRP
ncbi:MAG: MmgE/PrpD family protein [Chloroflexi bacterium]|nr:MmgE/PrpD family protein [Chloroflexota bacterium]